MVFRFCFRHGIRLSFFLLELPSGESLKVIMLIAGCGHSKEACSNHWHFCGSPPQEQIPRGTAGQCPEA
jgi:hypothetical protein